MPVNNCAAKITGGKWFDAIFDCYWASRVGGMPQLILLAGVAVAVGLWLQTETITVPATVLALTGGIVIATAPGPAAMIGWLVVVTAIALGLWNIMT